MSGQTFPRAVIDGKAHPRRWPWHDMPLLVRIALLWLVGMVLIFCFLNLTNYYWIMLCLVPLAGRPRLTRNLMLLNMLLCINHFIRPQFEWRYGIMSWLLAILFSSWLQALFKLESNQVARQE
jgi:hypothetical protein